MGPFAPLLLPLLVSAASATPLAVTSEELPPKEATVYSDRARVVRRGKVALPGGVVTLELPRLPPIADPSTVQLQASGANVRRVEVRRALRGEVPRSEAEALLKELEALDDQLAALSDERTRLQAERAFVGRVRPAAPVQPAGLPAALLDPSGWGVSMGFFDDRARALDEQLLPLDTKARALHRAREQLLEKIRQLAADVTGTPGFVVEAEVDGKGAAELSLTYVVFQARWRPIYDLRFAPGGGQVEVLLGAMVSQETGEDWGEVELALSTSLPAATPVLPKLKAWKIGERDSFEPKVRARPMPPLPWAEPDAPVFLPRATSTGEASLRLLAKLNAVAGGARGGDYEEDEADKLVMAKPRASDRREPPRPSAPPPPPPPMAMAPPMEREKAEGKAAPRKKSKSVSLGGVFGMKADAMPAPSMAESAADYDDGAGYGGLPVHAPGRFVPPPLGPDAPASLANGYAFLYRAAARVSVKSGPNEERVVLTTKRMPSKPRLVIVPALRSEAYAVAEVKNDGSIPLLAGPAALYVGADLTGRARLETLPAGGTVELPLGVDEAIGVERIVRPVTREEGLISKEEITRYDVTIQLHNPRKEAVKARVVDVLPRSVDEEVEATLVASKPTVTPDKDDGKLTWELELPAGAKKSLTFSYELSRPKGTRLRQR